MEGSANEAKITRGSLSLHRFVSHDSGHVWGMSIRGTLDRSIKRVDFGLIPTDPIDAATKQQTIVPNIPSDILNQGNFQDFSWLDLKRDS